MYIIPLPRVFKNGFTCDSIAAEIYKAIFHHKVNTCYYVFCSYGRLSFKRVPDSGTLKHLRHYTGIPVLIIIRFDSISGVMR